MYSKKTLINKIKEFLNITTLSSNYHVVLKYLYSYYRDFNEDIVIEDYSINKNHHYLSFKKREQEMYSFIELTEEFIEFRFPERSQFFIIDKKFINDSSIILKLFLKEMVD